MKPESIFKEKTSKVELLSNSDDFSCPVIYFKEAIDPEIEQVKLDFAEIRRIGNNAPYYLLIDLSQTNPPKFEVRAQLSKEFNALGGFCKGVLVSTGKNKLLTVAAKFIFSRCGFKNFEFFTSIEKALLAIPKK